MFVTCGRDGNIAVWDKRCSVKRSGLLAPANCIYGGHLPGPAPKAKTVNSQHLRAGVTAALFLGSNKIASAGAADG